MSRSNDRAEILSLRRVFGVVCVLLAALAYYRFQWSTFAEFASALDHEDQLFGDFIYYYRPMGQRLFALKTAVAGFHYPAFFALLMVPLALLPLSPAMWIWGAVQVVSIGCLASRCARALRGSCRQWHAAGAAICVTSFPVLHCFRWGQVSVLLTLCVIVAVAAYGRGRRTLAGVLLALATAIKLYPALFALLFVWRRDRRALASFAIGCLVAFVVLPGVFLGPTAALRFLYDMSIAQAGWIKGDVNSQYVVHVVGRHVSAWAGHEPGAWVLTIARWGGLAIALVHVALIRPLLRRTDANALPLAATLLFTTIVMVVPTSWPHYFAFLPWCQVVLLRAIGDAAPGPGLLSRWMSGAVFVSIALASVFAFQAFGDWRGYNGAGMLLLSDVLLLPPLYWLIAATNKRAA